MRTTLKIVTLIVGLLAGSGLLSAQTASGTLNATLINRSGIAVVFNSDPAGVVLGGAGTSTASLNFGTVAMYMATPAAGVSLTRTASDFTISSPFDTYVIIGGSASASYSLQAALQSASGVYTFKFDGIALTTTSSVVVAADPNYFVNVPHTLSLTVPKTAPAGAVSNTVNFLVTAN